MLSKLKLFLLQSAKYLHKSWNKLEKRWEAMGSTRDLKINQWEFQKTWPKLTLNRNLKSNWTRLESIKIKSIYQIYQVNQLETFKWDVLWSLNLVARMCVPKFQSLIKGRVHKKGPELLLGSNLTEPSSTEQKVRLLISWNRISKKSHPTESLQVLFYRTKIITQNWSKKD